MHCRFCSEVWKTKGRRGTRSRFSWFATLLWLFWIAVIVLIVYKYKAISQFASNTKEEEKRVQREVKANPKVPPIKFKSPKEIEAEKASELNEKSATKTSSSPVKVESPQNGEDALGLSITN